MQLYQPRNMKMFIIYSLYYCFCYLFLINQISCDDEILSNFDEQNDSININDDDEWTKILYITPIPSPSSKNISSSIEPFIYNNNNNNNVAKRKLRKQQQQQQMKNKSKNHHYRKHKHRHRLQRKFMKFLRQQNLILMKNYGDKHLKSLDNKTMKSMWRNFSSHYYSQNPMLPFFENYSYGVQPMIDESISSIDQNQLNHHKRRKNNSSPTKKPNIIFILTDDQDIELGSMNYMPKTMKIMANQGVHVKNAYSTTP
mgnify:CR=1 FL=1